MLAVTENAARHLLEALSRKQDGAPGALRIVNADEGYTFILDDPKEGDEVFEQEGVNYLLLDGEMNEALSNATLDIHAGPQGTRITLTGAQAT